MSAAASQPQPAFADGGPFRAALWTVSACEAEAPDPEEWLSAEERDEFGRIASARRRREWFAARVALKKTLLADGVARRAADASVRKDAAGAPRLVVRDPDTGSREELACSLSHSGDFVLCAWSRVPGARLGVDVERRTARLSRLRRKFANPADRRIGKDDPEGGDTVAWSCKEALSKLLGTGMACGFANLVCRETAPGACALEDPSGRVYEGRYAWFGDYVATAVFDAPEA